MPFEAGRLRYFADNWKKITSDDAVLDIVQHCHIQLKEGFNPINTTIPHRSFSVQEEQIIQDEIQKLLEMKVLIEVEHCPEEFLSPIFVVPKKDGEYRMILNLKNFNENIDYHHFKMDTFESALKLIKPNCFMASVDLRHAYYSIFISEEEQVKLRFVFKGKVFQYVSLANGIASAPRLFTRLMKPVYATLRQLGHSNSGFIDDSLLVGDTFEECKENIFDTVHLMSKLGFIVHKTKSVLVPTQNIVFLGNVIHSLDMTVTLPYEKVHLIVQECLSLSRKSYETIRKVARVIGLLISTFSAVEYGPLHYREIEKEKIQALKMSKGDFDCKMQVSESMKIDLIWWINNLASQKRYIDHGNPQIVITTDASHSGWGGVYEKEKFGGRWSDSEAENHINVLEMLAVWLALKSVCRDHRNKHVQIRCDNTCSVSYLNSMGGIKSVKCNSLAKQIWSWCIERDLWLSATHVPGSENEADESSRNFNENTEWMLNKNIFSQLVQIWQQPKIDMFASRLNKQIEKYVSWKRDPEALWINAFSESWSNLYFFAFPPFSQIMRCLQKTLRDRAECIMIVPLWPTQIWYPQLLAMLIDHPRILPPGNILTLPSSRKVHPLMDRLHLIACRLSGDPIKSETFRVKLPTSFSHHGVEELRNNILHISRNGFYSVTKNKLIQFLQM
ncbi:MAG: reverse transcriptase domain-containing protein [Candidatus Thiodiazotropha sp.]